MFPSRVLVLFIPSFRHCNENRKLFALLIVVVNAAATYHFFRSHDRKLIDSNWELAPPERGQVPAYDPTKTRIFLFPKIGSVDADGANSLRVTADVQLDDDDSYRVGNRAVVAIGGGMTSRGLSGVSTLNAAAKFQFFHTFLPSFCATASPSYMYRFYLAFDDDDPMLTNGELALSFQRTFAAETRQLCKRPRGVNTSLHFVQCRHSRRPAWAQNDAMLDAYLDQADYFYRINDDTQMKTGDWTEKFVSVLDHYKPRDVGVVGPQHSGGNVDILTYDFVHRTHIDVFGFYYPRMFTDWYADDWITRVYEPSRSTKVNDVRLEHTSGLGTRYVLLSLTVGDKLSGRVSYDKQTLARYINAISSSNGHQSKKADGRRVISMSLYGQLPRYVWGAIRNAQLVRVHFPGWQLRLYVPDASAINYVPTRIVRTLRQLGADIYRVSAERDLSLTVPSRDWRLLVADDETVDYFLIRDADGRLSDRDSAAVAEWIEAVETAAAGGIEDAFPVHRMFDHHSHTNRQLVDGLWGGRPSVLRHLLNAQMNFGDANSFHKLLMPVLMKGAALNDDIRSPLESVLEPLFRASDRSVFCHLDLAEPCVDFTPTADDFNGSCRPFPVLRRNGQYLGLKFDENHERTDDVTCSNTTATVTTTQSNDGISDDSY